MLGGTFSVFLFAFADLWYLIMCCKEKFFLWSVFISLKYSLAAIAIKGLDQPWGKHENNLTHRSCSAKSNNSHTFLSEFDRKTFPKLITFGCLSSRRSWNKKQCREPRHCGCDALPSLIVKPPPLLCCVKSPPPVDVNQGGGNTQVHTTEAQLRAFLPRGVKMNVLQFPVHVSFAWWRKKKILSGLHRG